ncbi:MAG: HTTM domain-containing protein [Planctomycetaceae bacterium]
MSQPIEHAPIAPAAATEPSVWTRLNNFFFAEERPVGIALVRIVLPLAMLFPTLHRIYRVREFYSLSGSPTPLWNNYNQVGFLPIPSAPVAAGLYALFILALVTSSVGWRTRISLVISALLISYFSMLDLISTMAKYVIICTHVMLLLSMSSCGKIWSVDRWLAVRRGQNWSETGPAWPRRLIQILIGVIYLAAAATKLHTPTFFTGDQLRFWLLTNVNMDNPFGEYLSQYPGMILVMVYVTIFWEIVFLFTCWKGVGRAINLSVGLLFHVMTIFTLGLVVFPLVYFVLYLAWYDERDHQRVKAWWQSLFGRDFRTQLPATESIASAGQRWGFPSLAAWGLCAAGAAGLGVWIDHNADPFGENRPEGRYTLKPLSEERAAELLRNDLQLDVADKVFSIDVGSVRFNDNLVDRKTKFRVGDKAMVQCSLLPPHEDLYMEAHLLDEEGRIVTRLWQVVARESMRGHFWFNMEDTLEPGIYTAVIRIDGQEAGSRTLELLPGPASASHNEAITEETSPENQPATTVTATER